MLDGSDLTRARLDEAGLGPASTHSEDRSKVDATTLANACLREASFKRATLRNARFRCCDLSRADFSDADLTGATVYKCELSGANFNGALFSRTRVSSVDVSEATLAGTRDGRRCTITLSTPGQMDLRAPDLPSDQLSSIVQFLLRCGVAEPALPCCVQEELQGRRS